MIRIPVDLTAAQVAACDASAVTVGENVSTDELLYVPHSLLFIKPAGSAYTIGAGCRLYFKDDDGNILFNLPAEGFLDQATAQVRYQRCGQLSFNAANYGLYLSATASVAAAAASPAVKLYVEYEVVPFK